MGDVMTMTWNQLRDKLDQAFQAEMTGFNSIWWWTALWDGVAAMKPMGDVRRHEWDITPGNRHFPDVLIKDTGVMMRPYRIVSERRGNTLLMVDVTGYEVVDGRMNDKASHVWHWDNESGRTLPPDLEAIVR